MNHEITVFRADIVVDNLFILELKATNYKLSDKEVNQIKRYMNIKYSSWNTNKLLKRA